MRAGGAARRRNAPTRDDVEADEDRNELDEYEEGSEEWQAEYARQRALLLDPPPPGEQDGASRPRRRAVPAAAAAAAAPAAQRPPPKTTGRQKGAANWPKFELDPQGNIDFRPYYRE